MLLLLLFINTYDHTLEEVKIKKYIILMGQNVSTTKKSTESNEVNKTITNFLTTNTNDISSTGMILQSNNVDIKNLNIVGCSATISNYAKFEQVTTGELSSEQIQEMANEVNSKMVEDFESKTKQVSDIGAGNKAHTSSEIKKNVENITKSVFETENYNKISASVVSIQDNKVKINTINCVDGEFEISNAALVSQITEALVKDIKKNVQKNKVLSEIESSYKAVTDQEQKGLFGMFSGLFGIIGCVICVALLVFLKTILSPAGQNGLRTVSNAAGKKIAGPMG